MSETLGEPALTTADDDRTVVPKADEAWEPWNAAIAQNAAIA
jgi:hypothetical protein